MTAAASGLRARTARGGLLTAGLLSGAEALVLLQGLLATALLGPDAIGLYGVVTTTAMTVVALRRVGIDESFVRDPASAVDERLSFERALAVELALGVAAAAAIAALAPVLAWAYGDDRLIALTLAVTYLPIAFALQAPQWIAFRNMDWGRLRALQAIVPVGTVLVGVPLLLAGAGVWALVVGPMVANVTAAAVAWRLSPYGLRPRFDRAATRRHLRFSWPILVTALALLVVGQGQIAVFGLSDGLVAAGYITLAVTLTRYADRADHIVAATLYPAIVRVQERTELLGELFAKANRLSLMWAFPYGAGLALFGGDLVDFVLGDEWRGAVVLLGGLAVATALQQLGYNWFSFYRARGASWPQAVESGMLVATFLAFAVPGALLAGAWGFVIGRVLGVLCVLAVRRAYVVRLLPEVRMGRLALAGLVPVALATAPVLALRALPGEGGPALALLELGLWLAGLAVWTWRLEGGLVRELRGYLR